MPVIIGPYSGIYAEIIAYYSGESPDVSILLTATSVLTVKNLVFMAPIKPIVHVYMHSEYRSSVLYSYIGNIASGAPCLNLSHPIQGECRAY